MAGKKKRAARLLAGGREVKWASLAVITFDVIAPSKKSGGKPAFCDIVGYLSAYSSMVEAFRDVKHVERWRRIDNRSSALVCGRDDIGHATTRTTAYATTSALTYRLIISSRIGNTL